MLEPGFTLPRPGDVLQVYHRDLIDLGIDAVERLWLIRRGVKPPPGKHIYSHTCVYIGNNQVAEAIGRGFVISPASKYQGLSDVWTRNVSTQGRNRMVNKAQWMVSQRLHYSLVDIGVIGLRMLFGANIRCSSPHAVVCSMATYDIWSADGWEIAEDRLCSPESIAVFGTLKYAGRF